MVLTRELQEFNLFNYVSVTLPHGIPGNADTTLPPIRLYSIAASLECVGWLELGAAVRYFPADLAVQAIAWVNQILHPYLDGFLGDWNYVLHPYASATLLQLMRSPTTKISRFEDPETIWPIFQAALTRATRLSTDEMAVSLTIMLTLTHFAERNLMLSQEVFLEDVARSLEAEAAFDLATFMLTSPNGYLGFSRWVQYLENYRRAMVSSSCRATPRDLRVLLRRIAQIQFWRLFGLSSQAANVQDTRTGLLSRIKQIYDLSDDAAEEVTARFADLLNFWESISQEVMSGGGSQGS